MVWSFALGRYHKKLKIRQWLWLTWQSGRFRYQWSAVPLNHHHVPTTTYHSCRCYGSSLFTKDKSCLSEFKSAFSYFFFYYGPLPASFCLFSFFSRYNFNWKKHRWCAWDSNPGPQDGRRRRNHGAMAATPTHLMHKFIETGARLSVCKNKISISWHLIAPPSTPDFSGKVGSNLALGLWPIL